MLITVGWLICGFLAYGLMKGSAVASKTAIRKNYRLYWRFHDTSGELKKEGQFTDDDEMACLTFFMFGPLALLIFSAGYAYNKFSGYNPKPSFCLKAPKELLEEIEEN